MEQLSDEMREFKDEMLEFKNESQRQSREMNRRWGELANRLGTVVEDIVAPNIPTVMATHFGCSEPDLMMVRPRKKHPKDGSRRREFDVVAVTPDRLFINETKSKPRSEDIIAFARNYREVLEYFPEYSDRTVIPILSSLFLGDDLVALLTEHLIYAMTMKGDTMDLVNAEAIGAR